MAPARAVAATDAAPAARTTTSFDAGWRFLKADAPGAEQPAFDDAPGATLDVPHDWSIEGPFDQNAPAGGAGAFLPTGIGWYRKHFTLPAADARRRVFVDFDGVMANSDVWINGFHLGHRPNGYVSFRVRTDRAPALRRRADQRPGGPRGQLRSSPPRAGTPARASTATSGSSSPTPSTWDIGPRS